MGQWPSCCQLREGAGTFPNGEPLKVLKHQKKLGKLSFGMIKWLQSV